MLVLLSPGAFGTQTLVMPGTPRTHWRHASVPIANGKAWIVQIDNLEESIAIGHGRRCGIIPAQEDQSDAQGQELVLSEQSCFK